MKDKNNIDCHKNRFLNSSSLMENFKKSYLNSLQIILDDEKFKAKVETLPNLKSSVINRYEKMFAKIKLKNKKFLNKEYILNSIDHNNIRSRTTSPNLKNNIKKTIPIRYIIIDNQLINLTLEGIEGNNNINNKLTLTEPFSSYIQESNPKIRKKAFETIINNIFIKPTKNNINENDRDNFNKTKNNILPKINNSVEHISKNDNFEKIIQKNDEIFYKDLDELEEKYKLNNKHNDENHEKYKETMKKFDEKCENNNIITLGQKIDYFTYLFKKDSSINPKITEIKNNKK